MPVAPRSRTLPNPLRVLTAAAQGIRLEKGKANAPPKEPWTNEAWDMFDLLPEVGQAATFMANVVGGVRLFIAAKPTDRDATPEPATNEPGADQAWELTGAAGRGQRARGHRRPGHGVGAQPQGPRRVLPAGRAGHGSDRRAGRDA